MTRALVLGAAGHIGAHVTRALLARGYAVRAAYRSANHLLTLEGLPIERVPVDVAAPSTLRAALDGCDWVFHCAGFYPTLTDRREAAIARGLAQIRDVFDVFRDARLTRIVYTSSAATIASHPDRPSTETDLEPWPSTGWRPLYTTVKIAMEHEVLRYQRAGLPVIITHPTVCLGEYDAHPFSGRLILLFAKPQLPCYVEHHLNVIYTGDVGVGHVRAAERGQPGAHYLLSERNMTLGALARLIAREAGVRPPWRAPYGAALAAAWCTEGVALLTRREPLLPRKVLPLTRTRRWFENAATRRALELPITPIDETVRRAIAWFRQHSYLPSQ